MMVRRGIYTNQKRRKAQEDAHRQKDHQSLTAGQQRKAERLREQLARTNRQRMIPAAKLPENTEIR